ncbi:MAG: RNA polymerase sigma factor [Armatimonadetes bacterium]|nr:RNA polymerase sigma factor [Armatimonadota bacterium]
MSDAEALVAQASELALVQRVARGDGAAVDAFYRANCDAVYRHVYRHLDERHEDAEEVTQDTFLGAISLAETYDGTCSVLTWLCAIARLRIADFRRKEGRQKRVPSDRMLSLDEQETDLLRRVDRDAADVEGILGRLSADRLVEAMLAPLLDDEREALLLRYAAGFSVREIANVMKRTEKGVANLLTRAKQKARRAAAAWL